MDKTSSHAQRPSGSSSLLTGNSRHSRLSSDASSHSRPRKNRNSIDHALDNIHSTASKSNTLTTFNEFSPVPLVPSDPDDQGLASQLQSGLGGVYSRLISSVGSSLQSRPQSPSSSRPPTRESNHLRMRENHRLSGISQGSAAKSVDATQGSSSPVSRRSFATGEDAKERASDYVNRPAVALEVVTSSSASSVHNSTKRTSHDMSSGSVTLQGADTTEQRGRASSSEKSLRGASISSAQLKEQMFSHSSGKDASREHIPDSSVNDADASLRQVPTSSDHRSDSVSIASSRPSRSGSPSVTAFRPSLRLPAARESMISLSDGVANFSEFGRSNYGPSAASSLLSVRGVKTDGEYLSNQQLQQTRLMNEMRRKVISRDFWMKDENAKVCFNCGDRFSTFRRKHHCRTCGQIYDAKCTVLIPGKLFGQDGRIRVCKTCEAMVNADDSSDYSEDDESHQPQSSKQIRFSDLPFDGKRSLNSSAAMTPNLDPSSRAADLRRRPNSGYFDSFPALTRPSSSRSLKSLSNRPRSASHRHKRSRQQTVRSIGGASELGNLFPYAQTSGSATDGAGKLPAFHADSIIDPDLAPFMSEDEEMSDDEAPGIDTMLKPDHIQSPSDFVFPAIGTPGRTRPKSSSRSVFDDAASIVSVKVGTRRRQMGARTLSTGSVISRHHNTPRVIRSENLFSQYDIPTGLVPTAHSLENEIQLDRPDSAIYPQQNDFESHSFEVDQGGVRHINHMLKQFFKDASIDKPEQWAKVLVPLVFRCATEVDPNISRGDDIDIRHYIKMKQAPGGSSRDTRFVSGVVFTKNLALKSMPRAIKYPRILLVSFPLEYARHQKHFMSLEPVIAQEKEYLRKLVDRIIALNTQILLVQGNVSGVALEFLDKAHIAVAYNVKESSLRAISRCTQTRIITSVDKLTMSPSYLGTCETFEVKTSIFGRKKKTHMTFAGCSRDLGCTIVLRGAPAETLSKMKPIVEFLCYVAYNLKLENALMRDEFIALPKSEEEKQSDSSSPQDNAVITTATPELDPFRDAPSAYGNMVQELRNRLLSVSPYVKLAEPYLLLRGYEQEKDMRKLWSLVDLGADDSSSQGLNADQKFELIKPEMVYSAAASSTPQIKEALRAIHRAEYDKALHRYTNLKRRWETYIAGASDPFSPYNHQQIITLFSIVSTKSADSCVGPDLLGLDFYQEQHFEDGVGADLPLGEYVERLTTQVSLPCAGQHCERKMIDHHRLYVHGEGQVSVFTDRLPSKIRGMENVILMWSTCRRCDYESQVTPMSSSAWKYSFGKYLELTFWSRPLRSRAGSCSHDVHKDHVRYFGFHDTALRILYDPISIMDVLVPRGTVAWKVDKDLEVKNREFRRIEEKLSRFMASVKARIRNIKIESIEEDKAEACREAIATMIKTAGDEHEMLLRKLQNKYMDSKFYEIIPLNRALRFMQERVAEWDSTFAEFEQRFFPSEKDIRRLAAQQLKKMYLSATEHIEEEDEKQAMSQIDADASFLENASPHFVVDGNRSVVDHTAVQERDEKAVEHLDLATNTTNPHSPLSRRTVDPENPAGIAQSLQDPSAKTQRLSPTVVKSDGNLDSVDEDVETTSVDPDNQTGEASKSRPTSPRLLRSATSPIVATRNTLSSVAKLDEPNISDDTKKVDRLSSLIPTPSKSRREGLIQRPDRILPERFGHSALAAAGRAAMQSMIPRPVQQSNSYNKVSALAKHFEAMSRQFERERIKERRQRAERNRQSRVYPMASFKPVVEVFRDAHEAVKDQDMAISRQEAVVKQEADVTSQASREVDKETEDAKRQESHPGTATAEQSQDPLAGSDELAGQDACAGSDTEALMSDSEPTLVGDQRDDTNDADGMLALEDGSLELPFDFPKHDRTSLTKMLSSFWSERSASGWTPLDYPLLPSEHIFADSDILVREDEPSSLVAFSLASQDYQSKLQKFREKARAVEERRGSVDLLERHLEDDGEVERTLLGKTATHMKYQFQAGQSRMQCKIFYAESFDAIRRKCGVAERFVESLSRCLKWDSRGGKTKSLFLKTLDERFIIKSLSPVETQAFLKFAPDYFDYMSKCLFHSLPSALAKMLGFYHVVIRNPITGTDLSYFLQVMENVFYEGPSNKMFDLKGSMRNRRVETTGEKDEVLLDENMLDFLSQSPVYIRNHSNSLLASSMSNDTLFCAKQNVMDYSLIVGLYDDRKEVMVGIIDYIRTYTWDKKLESWIKDRGKHRPTVRSPKEYRNRFRASIARYFPLAPSCWQVFGVQRTEPPMVSWGETAIEEWSGDSDSGEMEEI